jgi:hypothetical protein
MSCDPSASAVETATQLYGTAMSTAFNKDPSTANSTFVKDKDVIAYNLCSSQNSSIYKPLPIIQSDMPQSQKNTIEVAELHGQHQGNTTTYSSLLQSVKVMMAAAEPLTNYRFLLNQQLLTQTAVNKGLENSLTTNAEVVNILNSGTNLSSTGPFGYANTRVGIGYTFLGIYNIFFLVLAISLYVRFKNAIGGIVMGFILFLLLGGAIAVEVVYVVFPLIYNTYIIGAYGY